jgi:DNA repair protein RadD
MTTLWPHQTRALEQMRAAARGGAKSILAALPTGAGKTRLAHAMISRCVAQGKRAVFVCHRDELVRQTRAVLEDIGPVRVVAETDEGDEDAPIVVASIQTLLARKLHIPAALAVCDEAQHVLSTTWRNVPARYRAEGAHLIGLSATPTRVDGRAFGDLFDALVQPTSVRELQGTGILVPAHVIAPAGRRDKLAATIVDAVRQYAHGRGVVFAASVEESREAARDLTEAGWPAEHIDGETPTERRRDILRRFREGELAALCNVYVLTEGFDDPAIEWVALARGCGSYSMWMQIIGRALRAAPGKTHCTVLDLGGAVHEHGLPDEPRVYDLDGSRARTAEDDLRIRQCPECGAAFREGPLVCPRCGATLKPMRARRKPISPEELQRIQAVATVEEKQAYLERLEGQARAKGYRAGWVGFRFSAKFGHFPRNRDRRRAA